MKTVKLLLSALGSGSVEFFLICGPSCIGKSTFIARSCLFSFHFTNNNPLKQINDSLKIAGPKAIEKFRNNNKCIPRKKNLTFTSVCNILPHHETAVSSNPDLWQSDWFSENLSLNLGAIVLGVPYEEFLKRYHERQQRRHLLGLKKKPLPGFAKLNNLKQYYESVKVKLDDNNIPYVFVDNRNDYPIVDESSFFTMIT